MRISEYYILADRDELNSSDYTSLVHDKTGTADFSIKYFISILTENKLIFDSVGNPKNLNQFKYYQ